MELKVMWRQKKKLEWCNHKPRNTKEYLEPPEAERGKEEISSEPSEGVWP